MAEFAQDEDEDKDHHNVNDSNGQIEPKNKRMSRSNTVALDNCAEENGNCDPLPSAMKLKIKVHCDLVLQNNVFRYSRLHFYGASGLLRH